MDFENMNDNNNNDGFSEARRIIADAQRFRPMGMCCPPNNNNGATGPTGPTDTYDYFFKLINRNYSSVIPYKY